MSVTILGILLAGPAWGCAYPTAPRSIPDGRKADKEAMLATKREVDLYVREVHEYMSCESDGRKLQEVEAARRQITERFNAEVRRFKAVNGG